MSDERDVRQPAIYWMLLQTRFRPNRIAADMRETESWNYLVIFEDFWRIYEDFW